MKELLKVTSFIGLLLWARQELLHVQQNLFLYLLVTELSNISQPPLHMTELWPMEQGQKDVDHFQAYHTNF